MATQIKKLTAKLRLRFARIAQEATSNVRRFVAAYQATLELQFGKKFLGRLDALSDSERARLLAGLETQIKDVFESQGANGRQLCFYVTSARKHLLSGYTLDIAVAGFSATESRHAQARVNDGTAIEDARRQVYAERAKKREARQNARKGSTVLVQRADEDVEIYLEDLASRVLGHLAKHPWAGHGKWVTAWLQVQRILRAESGQHVSPASQTSGQPTWFVAAAG